MSPVLLLIEYRGTNFHGWQRQDGVPTVQETLEKALETFFGQHVTVRTSSRTDSGVHAAAHPAFIYPPREIPLKGYLRGVNSLLPRDVSVRQVARTLDNFDPRSDARGKTYIYRIWNDRTPRALFSDRVWHNPIPMDVTRMQAAAKHFIGTHNMSSFRAAHCNSSSVVRQIHAVEVIRRGHLIRIRFKANAFLRNMVRIMVGSLTDVGRGAHEPEWISDLIKAECRHLAGPTAPGIGLMLHRVHYPSDCFTESLPPEGPLTDHEISGDRDDDIC